MRVISGFLGGQIFDSPQGHKTHPMSEKVRGALFGSLGDIKHLTILDAFSGSGAIAIEAVSRGAQFVQAIEVDPTAYRIIAKNIKKFNLDDRVKATRAYAGAWSTRWQNKVFDVVILDPPFDNIPYRDLKRMPRHVSEGGILILSWPSKIEPLSFENFSIIRTKHYGDSRLFFYKKDN